MAIRVTAALLRDAEGRLLVARRAPGRHLAGAWEFPGGKIEPGEAPEACLARELHEELGITVEVGAHFSTTTHAYEKGAIELLAYEVRWTGGELVLRDHDALAWLRADELGSIALAPADVPIAQALARAT